MVRRAWTVKEVSQLCELAPLFTVRELCDKFDRSKMSITQQLYRSGVRPKAANWNEWKTGEVKLLESMMHDFPFSDIARQVGRTSASVRGYVYAHYDLPRRKKKCQNG